MEVQCEITGRHCEVCGVERANCSPGGQWYDVCPFEPDGGGHRWVD
jgi:hypothetical protein